jgi:hypothetical protein
MISNQKEQMPLKVIDDLVFALTYILTNIDKNEPEFRGMRSFGICRNITIGLIKCKSNYRRTYNYKPFLDAIFKKWPEFSGDVMYPVKSLTQMHFPSFAGAFSAERKFGNTRDMYSGSYGRARIRLLKFMISELTSEAIERRAKREESRKRVRDRNQ